MNGEVAANDDPQTPNRHLSWPRCYNVRDLGGLPTTDGRATRWRAVIRSDIPSRLTSEGQRALSDYGVRTIIDLRGPHEVAKYPTIFTGQGGDADGPAVLNLPLEKFYPHVSSLIQQATTRAEVYAIVLDYYPDAVAAVMRGIIQARPGGVLIHCYSGKDRTGIVAALLLSVAGVPKEIIIDDYAESQVLLRPLYEKELAEAGSEEAVSFWGRPTATGDMMDMMLNHVNANYGGVEPYLRGSGLSSLEIDQLRSRLLPTG